MQDDKQVHQCLTHTIRMNVPNALVLKAVLCYDRVERSITPFQKLTVRVFVDIPNHAL